jgi:hypothetical protein
MKTLLTTLVAAAALSSATGALAATDTATAGPIPVTGNVPTLCSSGSVTGGSSVFDLGVLVDTATGLLRTDLAAPPKVITGSFCNQRSNITVSATPMASQSFTGAPPAGFANGVNYTATASGWTTTPASFATGAASNPAATQSRATAFTGDITIGVSTFATVGGPALRLVADPVYRGLVTVTLAAAS